MCVTAGSRLMMYPGCCLLCRYALICWMRVVLPDPAMPGVGGGDAGEGGVCGERLCIRGEGGCRVLRGYAAML